MMTPMTSMMFSFRTQVRIFYIAFGLWIFSLPFSILLARGRIGGLQFSLADIGLAYDLFAPLPLAYLGEKVRVDYKDERRSQPFAFYSGLAAALTPFVCFTLFFVVVYFWCQ